MQRLQAKAENCFSSRYVLHGDGRAIGSCQGKVFSEGVEIHLTGQRRLLFAKDGWFSSTFNLTDAAGEQALGQASNEGWVTTKWALQSSAGPLELTSQGMFSQECAVTLDDQVVMRLERLGACQRGWVVHDLTQGFALSDLLLAGLVYQTILERRQRSSGAGAAGAGGGGGA
jgi:hypothetical protein